MKPRRPTRPTGARRPSHTKRTADPLDVPLDRAYAQSLRKDRKISYVSKAKRAAFWAAQSKQLAAQEEHDQEQELAAIAQPSLRHGTEFEGANIQTATLTPAEIGQVGEVSIAGIESGAGIAPPPPPR